MSLLQLRDLTVTVGTVRVCRELSLSIEAGQCWALLGANGAGKTTLLHTLGGLRAPCNGHVELEQQELGKLSRAHIAQRLGLVFQDESDAFPATVLETTLVGRHPHLRAFQWESPADVALARQALAALGLAGMESRDVATLSGGERRRLAIAAFLVQQTEVGLLDEPTNHLDLHHRISILQTLSGLCHEDGKAQVLALHDVNLAARYCDHVMLLYGDGVVEHGKSTELLTPQRLTRLYHHPIDALNQNNTRWFVPH